MQSGIKPPVSDNATRVDLGDDLLDSAPDGELSLSEDDTTREIPDQLHSAKILVGEGLLEDAKRILRQILVSDPTHVPAQSLMDQIQSQELKKILHSEARQTGAREEVDADLLIRKLDQDLGLGIFKREAPDSDAGAVSGTPFFKNPETALEQASPQDWIDLGIAFFEMELFGTAARLFDGALRRISADQSNFKADLKQSLILSSTCLTASSLIEAGRPFEAVSKLQTVLHDPEIKREDKVEVLYLMGRAYEAMAKKSLAARFYQEVFETEPRYRDIEERLSKKARTKP